MTVTDKIGRAFHYVCGPSSRRSSLASAPAEDSTACRDGVSRQGSTDEERSPTRAGSTLCAHCGKLDLRHMLEQETTEEDMGPLSKHLSNDCPLCNLIAEAVRRHWGDDWDSSRLIEETQSIPNVFIQSRSPVTIKEEAGHTEHPEPRLILALDISPPGHSENRRVIREVDRVKDRHIIAEIESVPGAYSGRDSKDPSLVPRRAVDPEIDYALVKRWLQDCKEHEHTYKAHDQIVQGDIDTGVFESREGFRLIDVEDECLVLKQRLCAFAALSYVWGRLPTVLKPDFGPGDVPILLTTKGNLESLSKPGGLSKAAIDKLENVRLPQTVVDAMVFSRRIGMRYLWIDTLCVVQDDKSDKSFLIKSMDDIYDIATVTYVAVAGSNADAGLRGVSPRKGRPISTMAVIDDGITEHLALSPPSLGEEVRSSVWNTRGWTFQEQALSQRCLYFTDNELYFNCIELQWREAYALEHRENIPDLRVRLGPPWWNRKLRKDPDPTPYHYLGDLTGTLTIGDYQAAVQDYSRKVLTFPDDVLNAFEGVFNRFAKCSASKELSLEQTQGIPVNHLHRALLWFPSEEAVLRQCGEHSDASFSTWSWASWDGPIEFVFADSMWLSRNISQAPLKKVPLHVLVPCWHYGGTTKRFFTQELWEIACQSRDGLTIKSAESCVTFLAYVQEKVGIDTEILLNQGVHGEVPSLEVGHLGFLGAYLGDSDVSLQPKKGRVSTLKVGAHQGEFRFDESNDCQVDEYVAIITSDTITKPPDTQAILLGLRTEDGVSRRVGVGWLYSSHAQDVDLPLWKYRFFKLV